MYRNYKLYDKAAISTVVGRNLLLENAARLKMKVENISFKKAQKEMRAIAREKGAGKLTNPFEKEGLYKVIGFNYINSHMISYLGINLKGVVLMFFTPGSTLIAKIVNHDYTRIDDSINLKPNPGLMLWVRDFFGTRNKGEIFLSVSVIVYSIFLYMLFFLSVPYMKNNKYSKLFLILSILIIMYITILTGPVGHARLRLPINPFIIILSSIGLYNLSIRNKQLLLYH